MPTTNNKGKSLLKKGDCDVKVPFMVKDSAAVELQLEAGPLGGPMSDLGQLRDAVKEKWNLPKCLQQLTHNDEELKGEANDTPSFRYFENVNPRKGHAESFGLTGHWMRTM